MYALLLIVSVALGGLQAQGSFEYDVVRSRSMQKDESGQLRINEAGIQYHSTNGKTSITLPFIDVHEMDVADPSAIRIETYEMLKRKLSGRRSYVFRPQSARGPAENDGHRFTRLGLAPDVNGEIALHHHVVRDQVGQRDVGARGRERERGEQSGANAQASHLKK